MPRLSVHILAGGERVPMLHDASGLPLFYPTLYATSQLRNAGAAVNTIRNKLTDIVVLMRWEESQGRDLVDEFSRGQLLSLADIISLRDFAKLDMRNVALDGRVNKKEAVSKEFLESRVGSQLPLPAVGGQQHYNRISTFADYLEFLGNVLTSHRGSRQVASDVAQMAATIRKHRPRGLASRFSENEDQRSPPTELVERFMAFCAENDSRNPVRDPGRRLRNGILFGLLFNTGMRIGEALSLRIDQLDLGHAPTVRVMRNQDDVHDSRRYQPVAKTKERLLPLPDQLGADIQRYIMQVRAKIPPARRHPYLIVSHRKDSTWGRPLSMSGVRRIFERMHAADLEFKSIHPHAFRHHFNHVLSVEIDAINARVERNQGARVTEARELDVRAHLNGHRSKASGEVYNRRHIREVSGKAARKVQAALNRKDPDAGGTGEA